MPIDCVFVGCSNLNQILVGKSNTVYHSAGNCLIETGRKILIRGCNNSVIPTDGSVTSIGGGAFSGCSSLTSITIPDSVTSIGNGAFADCVSLTSITISAGMKRIDDSAFLRCESLYQIVNHSDMQFAFGSNEYGKIAKNACIIIDKNGDKTYRNSSDGFIYIDTADEFLFKLDEGSKSYILIAYLGNEDAVTLPSSCNGWGYTIYQLRGVKNVLIPDSMKNIGYYAFSGCRSLMSITVGNSVKSIDEYAFSGCDSLTSIIIPVSVTSIGKYAFYECSSLMSVTVGNGVKSIDDSAINSERDFQKTQQKTPNNIENSLQMIA